MVDRKLLALINEEEKRKYVAKHGWGSSINMFHGLPWKGEESERVYKICNEKGITWEEYYGVKSEKGRIF